MTTDARPPDASAGESSQSPQGEARPDAAHGSPDGGPPHGKQFVKFSFFRLSDSIRAAPDEPRNQLAQILNSLLDKSGERMLTRTYSTIGTRADTDFLVWQVSDDLRMIMDWHAALVNSPLGAALHRPYSYLSMTMRSQYKNLVHPETAGRETLRDDGGVADYLFVYPMVKTRTWYTLPIPERQRIMNEHIAIGHKYHDIQINTTYSFGLDDQEFVVAFEGNDPGAFLALVRELRDSESSAYTERDTPAFTCRRMAPPDMLFHIGLIRPPNNKQAGPPGAQPGAPPPGQRMPQRPGGQPPGAGPGAPTPKIWKP